MSFYIINESQLIKCMVKLDMIKVQR